MKYILLGMEHSRGTHLFETLETYDSIPTLSVIKATYDDSPCDACVLISTTTGKPIPIEEVTPAEPPRSAMFLLLPKETDEDYINRDCPYCGAVVWLSDRDDWPYCFDCGAKIYWTRCADDLNHPNPGEPYYCHTCGIAMATSGLTCSGGGGCNQ